MSVWPGGSDAHSIGNQSPAGPVFLDLLFELRPDHLGPTDQRIRVFPAKVDSLHGAGPETGLTDQFLNSIGGEAPAEKLRDG